MNTLLEMVKAMDPFFQKVLLCTYMEILYMSFGGLQPPGRSFMHLG